MARFSKQQKPDDLAFEITSAEKNQNIDTTSGICYLREVRTGTAIKPLDAKNQVNPLAKAKLRPCLLDIQVST